MQARLTQLPAQVPVRLPESRVARWALGVGGVLVAWLLAAMFLPNGAPVGVLLIGAVLGSAGGLTAVGLVLVWRSAKIVNFAIAAMGSAMGLTSIRLHTALGLPYPVALVAGVMFGVIVGVGVDALVMRRFATAPRLIASVATIGLAQLLGGIEIVLATLLFRENPGPVTIGGFETPLSSFVWVVGAHQINGNHLLIVMLAPLMVVALELFLRKSLVGTAIRGSAENREWARLLGIRVARLSLCSWGVVGGLAAATYMLQAPFIGTMPQAAAGASALMLPLAAALIGRLESLRTAFVAAIGLGALDQLVRWNSPRMPALAEVVLFVVILGVLLLRRAGTSRAKDQEHAMQILPAARHRSHRFSPKALGWMYLGAAIVAVLAALWLPQFVGDSTAYTLSIAGVWGLVAVSTVVATGWTGQLSLGQFAIVGVAAVVAGNVLNGGNDLILAFAAAVLTGMAVAAIIGIPAMRIRGPFLGIATLAFAVVVDSYLLNPNYFPDLLPQNVKRPAFFDRWPLEHEQAMLSLTLICLLGALLLAASVRATRSGRHLLASRDNPKGLEAMGGSSKAAAMKGFVLSGAIAGLGGAIHVMLLHGVRFGSYEPGASVESFSATTIGGLSSLWGSVLAAFGLRATEDALTPEARLITMGLGVLIVLWLFPAGIAGVPSAVRGWLAKRRGKPAEDEVVDIDLLGAPQPEPVAITEHVPLAVPRVASEGLEVSFGRLQVLFGLDIEVADGEILALLGTNGAGKSTWLRAVMGLNPSSGTVTLAGADISGKATEDLVRQGISLMMGGKSTFPTLTVDEHLRLAGWIRRDDHDGVAADRDAVLELFPSLVARAGVMAGDLSGGEQQQLALAQTLIMRPSVLFIDELSLGLSPIIVGELMGVVKRLHDDGITIVVVEQSVNVAMSVAERAVFLEKGRVRYDGPTKELLERSDIVRSIFFDAADKPDTTTTTTATPVRAVARPQADLVVFPEPGEHPATVLACTDVRKRFGGVVAVDDVSLEVQAGEIVGLIGQNGAGKSTLLDCLSGFYALDGGRILLRGKDVTDWAPWERALTGLGRTFQEARLFPALTVAETVAVARERHVANHSFVADALRQPRSWESEQEIAESVETLLHDCGLEPFRDALTSTLSTGTRRVVELACALAAEPTVLLLDEPSAGVAQREAEALAGRLLDLRERTGAAMVIVEHDMGLVRSVSDRLVALELGGIIAEGLPDDVIADPKVIASYLGTEEVAIARSDDQRVLATRQ